MRTLLLLLLASWPGPAAAAAAQSTAATAEQRAAAAVQQSTATEAEQPKPRVTFDQKPVMNGRKMKSRVQFDQSGGLSRPYAVDHVSGVLNDLSDADSLIFLFLTSGDEDTRLLDQLLQERHGPQAWSAVRDKRDSNKWRSGTADSLNARLFSYHHFVTLPLNSRGWFGLDVNEHGFPEAKIVTLVDTRGNLAGRRLVEW